MEKKFGGISLQSIPVFRPLVSLIFGILIQYYFHFSIYFLLVFTTILSLILLATHIALIKFSLLYKWAILFSLFFLFATIGGILAFFQNKSNNQFWISNYYKQGMPILITLKEPPIPKEKTIKLFASAEAVLINRKWQNVEGDVLIYLKRGDSIPLLNYGSQLIITSILTPIILSGNPGGFNYREYCALKNICYQGFLTNKDFKILNSTKSVLLYRIIYKARSSILTILRRFIHNPNQLSVAEALLIGYRNDLDKELIKAYSNTGVIHIIVIAGLHLGMIYSLLLLLFRPFKNKKWCIRLKPIIILIILWGFCLITGANTPILRSTVMFSFILLGELIGKKTNIYNSLALSAFCILIIDPYSLFEAGFQFSYAAVLSIITFSDIIHKWMFFKNKLLHFIWNICAVTISAQILTLPLVIYYFHRIPTLFVIINIFAVPLAGIILYFEIFLILISSTPILAKYIGNGIEGLLWAMNNFINNINELPFSGWENLQISISEVIFIYSFLFCFAVWIMQKNNHYFVIALVPIFMFVFIRSIDFVNKENQLKMIVYNIDKHSAIDLIDGRKFVFVGDSVLNENGFMKDYHLQPARILFRTNVAKTLKNASITHNFIYSNKKTILIIDERTFFNSPFMSKSSIDAIILKKNTSVSLKMLTTLFNCQLYVWDASNSRQRREFWKKEADSLSLPCYSVPDSGAFIMNL